MRNSARRRSFHTFLLEAGSDCSALPGCRGGPASSRKFGIITLFKQETKRSAQVACHLALPLTGAFLKKGNTRQSSLIEDLSSICFRTWTLASLNKHREREECSEISGHAINKSSSELFLINRSRSIQRPTCVLCA